MKSDELRSMLAVAREADVLSFEAPVEGGVLRVTFREPAFDPGLVVEADASLPDLREEAAEKNNKRAAPRGIDPDMLFRG
jgi:hypothetical protein